MVCLKFFSASFSDSAPSVGILQRNCDCPSCVHSVMEVRLLYCKTLTLTRSSSVKRLPVLMLSCVIFYFVYFFGESVHSAPPTPAGRERMKVAGCCVKLCLCVCGACGASWCCCSCWGVWGLAPGGPAPSSWLREPLWSDPSPAYSAAYYPAEKRSRLSVSASAVWHLHVGRHTWLP